MTFAERLKELRLAKGLSQGDVADLIGVTRQAVSAYEHGRRIPEYENLEILADYFNVDMDFLMGRTNKVTTVQSYYLEADARELVNFLQKNPEYKVLFDASRKVKKEDIELVKNLIERMS